MARIIVDGYNLIAKMDRMPGKLEARRERLIRLLSGFRAERGHEITLVFDGERGDWPTESHERTSGIDVVFSRIGEKADHVIKRMAEDTDRECIVVTSDREVASYAETCGHVAVRSEDFLGRLRSLPTEADRMEKGDDRDDPSSNPSGPTGKKGNPRRLPKGVRRREQKLRNL